MAFIERVEKAAPAESTIRLITFVDGKWITVPRTPAPAVAGALPAVVGGSKPLVVAAPAIAVNTRRAPRFLVKDPLNAVVESGTASLVDISVLGAQVVSHPALRPNQTIKIALPDIGEMLQGDGARRLVDVRETEADGGCVLRAGIEFTDAAQLALEDYRLRHCAEDHPVPRPLSLAISAASVSEV
jgi:hypothetical protein